MASVMNHKCLYLFSVLFLFTVSVNTQAAQLPQGKKTISLINNKDEALVVGEVDFQKDGDKLTYEINFKDEVFSDEFLSMRPFKCIHQPKQMVCHLVYPYEKKGFINKDDLMDLEYDLLFLHKSPDEYGINAWNGLFYQITANEESYNGQLMEVDLNVLAAPPEDGMLRPVTRDMLYEADPEIHMFPKLVIE